jgi:geranylgeranyl reductase family protein
MFKDLNDIIIIGAGPAGSIAAKQIKELDENIDVLILEEHYRVGEPMQCAGLISVSGFKRLEISLPKNSILNTVKGAIFHSPNGSSFQIKSNTEMARVIDRRIFDKYLLQKAIKKGVRLNLGTKVKKLRIRRENKFEFVEIEYLKDKTNKKLHSKIVIDAEGVKGNILRGSGYKRPNKIIPAIQLELIDIDIEDKELVELFFGRKISPGFFSYIIPTSKNSARIAAASSTGNPYYYLLKFLKKNPLVSKRIKDAKIIETMGGSILTGGPIKQTSYDNLLIVGDAAGQVKATTGGGVIMGGLCSKIAGKTAVDAIHRAEYSRKFLKNYDIQWKKRYLQEFRVMNIIRTLINSIPDPMINSLFKSIGDSRIIDMIESHGDMDFQSSVIKKVLFSYKMPLLIANFVLNLLINEL